MLNAKTGYPIWIKAVMVNIAILLMAGGILLLDSQPAQTNALVFPLQLNRFFSRHQSAGKADGSIWKKKDYVAINQRFEAIYTDFPKDLIKAIAWCESEWSHVDYQGNVFYTVNYHRRWTEAGLQTSTSLDWGIMQINEKLESLDRRIWDLERIKSDPEYNLRAGVAILESKREYVRHLRRQKNWPDIEARYNLKGYGEMEIILKAYNGFQPSWKYLHRVHAALVKKPWEKAMLRQLFEEARRPETSLWYMGERPVLTLRTAATSGLALPSDSPWTQGLDFQGEETYYRLDYAPKVNQAAPRSDAAF